MSSFQFYNSPQSNQPSFHSPNINHDVDFYRRKSDRLEQDLLTISDELNKARLRLRRAEDFQIKFDLLLKQKHNIEEDNISKNKQLTDIKIMLQQLQLSLKDSQDKIQSLIQQKTSLIKDIQSWKSKFLQSEQRLKMIGSQEQERAADTIQKQMYAIKKNYAMLEQEYKFQINKLIRQLEQKKSVEKGAFEKQERLKSQKQSEILRLQEIIEKSREQYLGMVDAKNKEIEAINSKLRATFNQEIYHLKDNTSNQNIRFLSQLDQLKQILQLKNDQINHLHQELKANLQKSSSERDILNAEIKLLKEKIYERERQNEIELINMKERLITMHTLDIETMKEHYDKSLEQLKKERKEMEKIMMEKDQKVAFERREFERGRQELRKIIQKKEQMIEELKKNNSESGVANNKEFNNIYEALNKLTNEKQILGSEYQSNVIFLNQQIIKLTTSNELKNNQIRQLHQYNAILKKEHFESLKDLQNKWKFQRRQREIERQRERDARQKVQEQFRQKEKQWRNKQRQLQRDCQKERRQKNKWIANNEKISKQLQRVVKENDDLQGLYKNSLTSNQKTIIVTGDSKRQLSNELQKQKNELESRKRLQIDQIKKEYELQVTRLTHDNQNLMNQRTRRKIEIQKLQNQLHKVSNQYKNMEKINKQKVIDYSKKMAALNSQILLTQNLYHNFIEAKSRVVKKS